MQRGIWYSYLMADNKCSLSSNDTGKSLPESDVGVPACQVVKPTNARQIYLITYSQADLSLAPTREAFSTFVLEAFENADPCSISTVLQWVCSKETHTSGGMHYHMAVKLGSRRRWLKIRNYLELKHGINVHFSGVHVNYYSAWRYTTKDDEQYIESENHPDLTNSEYPITTRASLAIQGNDVPGVVQSSGRKRKLKRLSVFDVSQIAVAKGIKTRLELLVLASKQKKEGKIDLAEFIANRGNKAVEEALTVGWEMEEAEKKLERSKLTRIQILYAKLGEKCVEGCNGRWLAMANDILKRNEISTDIFAEAVRSLLDKGRGKYRNLYIKGPANCGKTFLLNPLNLVYCTFANPATTTFAWIGAETAEVIFLNDFRWSCQIIPWHDLLLLLEGQLVHLPAPKTHYMRDVCFSRDTPIFCTAKEELFFVHGGVLDGRETEMMRVRWKVFSFHSPISEEDQVNISSCPRCFAELIFPQH